MLGPVPICERQAKNHENIEVLSLPLYHKLKCIATIPENGSTPLGFYQLFMLVLTFSSGMNVGIMPETGDVEAWFPQPTGGTHPARGQQECWPACVRPF